MLIDLFFNYNSLFTNDLVQINTNDDFLLFINSLLMYLHCVKFNNHLSYVNYVEYVKHVNYPFGETIYP